MIKMMTAHTFEVDDTDAAVRDIQEQLQGQGGFLKNTVGLLFCYLDFIKAGTVEAVCKALPFDTLGCTTLGSATPAVMGDFILTLAVLTSDDVFFKTGVSDSLDGGDGETQIRELYGRVSGSPESPPSLMLLCHANPKYLSGDRVLYVLDRLSGGTPVFGTYALDETFGRRTPMILHNGSAYADRLALLAVCGGDPESRFTVKSLPAMNFYSRPVLVTDARENKLISINNAPAVEFMEKAGLISEDKLNVSYGFPLLIDNNDGTEVKSCAVHGIEEGGSLRCGSVIAKGATLKLANQMQKEVLRSSEQLITSIQSKGDKKVHLIFSCFGRSAPLLDLRDEMELFQKNMEGMSYVFIYSGGEFCPVHDEQGGIHNRFHQYSIISASF